MVSTDHVTLGIWIWNQVIRVVQPNGDVKHYGILDTQGTPLPLSLNFLHAIDFSIRKGCDQGREQLNLQLTALSAVLSSVLVFHAHKVHIHIIDRLANALTDYPLFQ
jgi:hypothetical protein